MTIAARSDPIVLRTTLLRGNECFELFPAFSADGALLASAGWFSTPIVVWDTATGKHIQVFTDDLGSRVAFSPQSRLFATAGDEAVSIWDFRTGARVARFRCDDLLLPDPQRPRPGVGESDGPISEYRRLCFDARGTRLILLTDEFVRAWDVQSRREEFFHRFGRGESGMELIASGNQVLVLTSNYGVQASPGACRSVSLFGLDLPKGVRTFIASKLRGKTLFTPDRRWAFFAVGGEGAYDPQVDAALQASGDVEARAQASYVKQYEVWDLVVGKRCGSLSFDGRQYTHPVLSMGGWLVATLSTSDHEVAVWDTRTGVIVNRIRLPGYYPPLGFSPTHQLLAILMYRPEELMDQTLFYEPLSGHMLGRAHHYATPLVFSPCGRWCVSVLSDNTHLWRTWPEPNGTAYLTDLTPILPLAQKWEPASAG